MITNSQLLLDSLPEAILQVDKVGFIKYANQTLFRLTGYNPEEVLNQHISTFYVNNDLTKSEFELSMARKKGQFASEGWKVRKNGSEFWAIVVYITVFDSNGSFTGFTCTLSDISNKKNSELELRRSEEQYRLMVEDVKDYAIFMLDPTGHILTWNEGAKKINGYSKNEIIGKHFSVFYSSKDIADKKPERELAIAIESGKYEEEGWRVKKDGSLFWTNVVITPLYNELNKLIGFSKVTRDLSERKEREEQLRQSEERYRYLVEQVTDYGIFMLDEKGRIISWNEGAKKIKGYSSNEIIGKYFSIFYPEEDILNNKPANELKIAIAEGKYEEEGWRVKKDGSLFWANIVITAVYNNKGVHIGFSKVTRDLTERKENERVIRESYERYRQLANELKVTNAELSYANHELEQFTSIVSHDLQEPIRTIKSFLQLINMKLSDSQSADLKSYIEKSINASNRMKELIQNLLNYSQLSRDEIVVEKVDVNDLFNEALQNVKTAVEASNSNIKIENEVDYIFGDRIQLVQLIQNLLSNAMKFTQSDHPQITIRCTRENGQVKFAISDNGIGIAEGDLNKVFEIFRRLSTEKTYPGTGIGLAICKKIVDRHHGKIWPESEIGKGTTFYFTLNDEAGRLQTA